MKISIIGPSGSGKTYLSKKLSERTGIPLTNLDYIFYRHIKDKSREELPENEWKQNLFKIISSNNWIIEGTRPLKMVFDEAYMIIVLNPSIITSLFRQWKRYCTDPRQRKEHGFINNLKLSRGILRQYFEKEDLTKADDPTYYRISKVKRILKEYKSKLIQLNTSSDVMNFITNFRANN